MTFFRFLISKHLWISIGIMIIIAVTGIFGVYHWLLSYTKQGQTIEIPDVTTYTINELEEEFEKLGLRYEIIDSAEYDPSFPRLSVIDLYPPIGSVVKPNRKVSVTLNAAGPRKINVPDVIDKTRRRAIYDLESMGFEIGDFVYVPHIGRDVVLGLRHRGSDVQLPATFQKGTRFDIVVGMGLSDERVRVPYLKNINLEEAKTALSGFGLNVGALLYDEEITDSSSAFIYRQEPAPSWEPTLRMGATIDLWLTNDENKRALDSLSFEMSNPLLDSLDNDIYNDQPEID
jgi:beta-lactam-binding protein with PASTA domain